jgi:hypothetical protein
MFLELPPAALNTLGENTADIGGEALGAIASNPSLLVGGIVLIIGAILIFFFIKKIIVNTVLGFVAWILFMTFVGVDPGLTIPSLAVSVIFGLAGVGVLLVLKFFGVI